MAEALPLAYDLVCFDETGQEFDGAKTLGPLSEEGARELQFMEKAIEAGAASYKIRVMRPGEVKDQIKAERKARGEDFGSQVLAQLRKYAGVDDLIGLITYMEAPRKN